MNREGVVQPDVHAAEVHRFFKQAPLVLGRGEFRVRSGKSRSPLALLAVVVCEHDPLDSPHTDLWQMIEHTAITEIDQQCGFAVALNGMRVWFAGDTAYHPEFAEIGTRCGPFDIVMIPIGAYEPRWFMERVHVNPEEAVRIYQDVSAAHPAAEAPLMLGIHWGTFRLTDEPMDEPPRRTVELWRERGLDEKRLWLARFGETRPIGD